MTITDNEYSNKQDMVEAKAKPDKKEDKQVADKNVQLDKKELEALAEQCKNEYDLAWKHQKPKKDEALVRLKLFNNQKRDKDAVGDTTMFSIFQTVLASLYTDRLMVDFRGKEEGDDETADNLNAMAKSDYDDMEKDQLDYDWDWDTCFFGRGLVLMEEFKRDPDNKIFYPLPEVLDPVTWLRDPSATSVNGNAQGKGAMRFGGSEVKMTKADMQNHVSFFKDIEFKELKHGSSTYSLLEDGARARDLAQGNQSVNKEAESNLGVNAQYSVTQWFTHFEIDGKIKKVKVWLANDRTRVVGIKVFKRDFWPIIDRALYPTSHDWDGTSIPDLTEDKQRARAIAQNLGLKSMKADLYPMYVYDTNKIKDKNDLNFDFNKFVGVDAQPGEPVTNSVSPMVKAHPNMQLLQFIYESLNVSAQVATATPDIKMGMQSQANRPLGETNILSSNVDTRYSLAAKVFGWSEKRFWQQDYILYKDNFAEDIDEKVLRVVGAFGAKWRPLGKSDIICRLDPDVYIESKVVSRAKDMEDRLAMTQYISLAFSDPTVNRRYGLKKLGKLNGLGKDELDRLFPPTIDERIATDENDMLNNDKLPQVKPEDDHNVHLEIHAMAKETDASKAHIETHKKALSIKKTNPELFPADQNATMMNQNPINGTPGAMPGKSSMQTVTPSMTSGQA